MEYVNQLKRALVVLLACVLGVFYSAHPYPRQITDNNCINPVRTPQTGNLGVTNLAPNPTLAPNPAKQGRPLGWFPSSYGANKADFQYLNSGYGGNDSVKVSIHSYKDGGDNWAFDNLPVVPDQQYYFSVYYRSSIDSRVEASFIMPDGSTQYETLGFPSASKNWSHFQTTFTAPKDAQTFSVYQYIEGNGYLTTSDYALRTYQPSGFKAPMLTLTFDDGYESTYHYGLPMMKKYGFNSTQFIITDVIGDSKYITPSQVRDWIANGHEIASHTVTHDSLKDKSENDLHIEVAQSQATLARITHNKINDFAYPLGIHNKRIDQVVASQYSAARGVESGLNSKDNLNCYNLKAEDVHRDTSPEQIADWIKQAQATNTWLILVYHSVEPDQTTSIGGSLFNVTPDVLDSHLKVIKASGIHVVTMAQAVNDINGQSANQKATNTKSLRPDVASQPSVKFSGSL